MNDLWLRVCSLIEQGFGVKIDPATVRRPNVFITQPDLIYIFSGDRRSHGPALYVPSCNTVMVTPDYDRGHLAHEFAEAVVYQSPAITFKETEDYARYVEANL